MTQATEATIPSQAFIKAAPIEVAGKVVQPVACMQKWQLGSEVGGAAFVRLAPHALHVKAGDETYSVPLSDPDQAVLKQIFSVGAVISGICLLIMALTWIASSRQ